METRAVYHVGNVRQLTTEPTPRVTSIDALVERRVTDILGEFARTYSARLDELRALVEGRQATERWPERLTPARLAAYLDYASSDTIPDSWKALRHRDPLDGAFFYLKAEVDAELARRAA